MDVGAAWVSAAASLLVAFAAYLSMGARGGARVRLPAIMSRLLRRARSAAGSLRVPTLGGAGRRSGAGMLGRLFRAREERARREACLAQMPEMVDVVVLGLSAGVSFDAALGMYCSRYRTLLASELASAMRSWELGFKTRRQALEDLAARMGVEAFATFVATVNESIEFGAPLAEALVEQGEIVRAARRSELQERIEKAPVKMLVPVGTMVLPAMLLAILGPMLCVMTQSV